MDMLTLKGERRSRIYLNAVNRPAHRIEYWCAVLAEEEVFKRETLLLPSSVRLLKAGNEIFHGNPMREEG